MKTENDSSSQHFEDIDLDRYFSSNIVPEVYQLIRQEHYNQSLKLINDFYFKNAYRDRSGKLKDKCDKWIALVLEEAERYDESLQLLRQSYANIQPDDEMYVTYQTDIVRILMKMGQLENAILESEITLDKQIDGDAIDLLTFLFYYVQVLQHSSSQLPRKYCNLITVTINELCPGLLELNSVDSSENACKVILDAYEQHSAANKRYSKLIVSLLNEAESSLDKISLLKKYIQNENFTFYKNLAIENLLELENN